MSHLFQPLSLRSVTLRNRLVVSPMCQYSCENGYATDWHLVHLGSRAVGGAGLIFTEAAAVSPEGRISPADLGIWEDGQIEKLTQITAFLKAQGATPGIQLAHAGRKAGGQPPWLGGKQLSLEAGGWVGLAPSAIPFYAGDRAPREASLAEIQQVVADFRAAAQRSLSAGFEIIELHAAHGYLLHEFLSPVSNQRTDAYGGSFENRVRLLLEVVEAVREVWPDHLPFAVRISGDDWLPDREAWTIEQSVELAKRLQTRGVDMIDVSSAGIHPDQQISVGAAYQLPFAERIKRESGICTGTVGMITNASQAETILRSGQADLIFMARELLRNPYFAYQAAEELHDKTFEWPNQYARAR